MFASPDGGSRPSRFRNRTCRSESHTRGFVRGCWAQTVTSPARLRRMGSSGVQHQTCEGELVVAGAQVSPGYWQRFDENARAFIMLSGTRFYRTGDLCRLNAAQEFVYCGRIDEEAKINGYRIHMAEVRAALSHDGAVSECEALPIARHGEAAALGCAIVVQRPAFAGRRDGVGAIGARPAAGLHGAQVFPGAPVTCPTTPAPSRRSSIPTRRRSRTLPTPWCVPMQLPGGPIRGTPSLPIK